MDWKNYSYNLCIPIIVFLKSSKMKIKWFNDRIFMVIILCQLSNGFTTKSLKHFLYEPSLVVQLEDDVWN